MTNRENYINSLTDEEVNTGLIKFNIPANDDIYSLNGEGVWGYAEPQDKEKYHDDTYTGTITAILLNEPMQDCGLHLFDEVQLVCHGDSRPTVDPKERG